MHYAAVFFILAVLAIGGWVVLSDAPQRDAATEKAPAIAAKPDDKARAAGAEEAQTAASDASPDTPPKAGGDQAIGQGFDIAKIDPGGTSVFAGKAEPRASVTVLADNTPIGTVQADESGEWVLVTEQRFGNPDPKLSISVGKAAPAASVEARPAQPDPQVPHTTDAPAAADPTAAAPQPTTAAAVRSQLMDALKLRIEQARAVIPPEGREDLRLVSQPPSQLAAADSIGARLPVKTPGPASAVPVTDVVPIPIQFIYREADFTAEGKVAAELLLEYLLIAKPTALRLTGHADERGTHDFNMELSARRLETVSMLLRAGGYQGAIDLVPKGDTEPFQGVDRSRLTRDELYDLDRRVELHLSADSFAPRRGGS